MTGTEWLKADHACRTCRHWKRSVGKIGDCEHPELWTVLTTSEDFCEMWWPKVTAQTGER